jgi:hypothetical protein
VHWLPFFFILPLKDELSANLSARAVQFEALNYFNELDSQKYRHSYQKSHDFSSCTTCLGIFNGANSYIFDALGITFAANS